MDAQAFTVTTLGLLQKNKAKTRLMNESDWLQWMVLTDRKTTYETVATADPLDINVLCHDT